MFGKKKKGKITAKNPDSKKYKRQMAEHLDGMSLKCVTEKTDGVEEVIGKKGSISVRDGELIVLSDMDIVFRTPVLELSAWELMSLDGVVLTGPDGTRGGEVRTVTAFYSYWRNLDN